MSTGEFLRLTHEGAIARLRFTRPETLNALDLAGALALRDAARAIAADNTVRAVLIEAEGRAFLAGGDVAAMTADPEWAPEVVAAIITPFHEALLTLRRQPAPVVAAIHGAVAGGGFSLALACDIVIAADNTRLVYAYTKIGTTADGGATWFLPRVVGLRRALEIALLSEPLDAAQALALGLVTQVVPQADLSERALVVAQRLAEGPTGAFAQVRRLMETAFDRPLSAHLEEEQAAFVAQASGPDFHEGCCAFLEKRAPVFLGR
ncbi:enoyl-CoA hydratase/isomerase family protein [Pararhodospirillum photometricum]|uniref:Enoyl-CoA hydratase/isomerase n=1 Tax=Pararhodospirillum photometricum DSM 122 TaxID=1150469 RepID=H6SLQ3_PARPM|nr:enoyl-CoA hydratase-related protein [Pararhodospirillum photometricum]CCG08918.1 Enoyl-CoA hydratase/isomerase [Pararhodospirillum photometricum DSM 122]